MSMRSILIVAAVLAMTTGCTITRPVTDDYAQYLSNNKESGSLPKARVAEQYYLAPATQAHRYEFRSAMTGQANLWVVEFGKVLDATMQSADVVAALGAVSKAGSEQAANGNTLVFNLKDYRFADHGAHVDLEIGVRNAQGEVFRKSYRADGPTQGGKMFWAGAFGMKNAVQQSTKLAMDNIMGQFIRDIGAVPGLVAKQ
jgi:hypothetical protein